MVDPISRICLILAASDLSSSDFKTFSKWISDGNYGSLNNVVENIRELAGSARVTTSSSLRAGRYVESISSNRPSDDTIKKVENMLLNEAGLGKVRAASMLYERLSQGSSGSSNIPDYRKIAFSTWLGRVLERVSPSELLHLSTKIRNELINSGKSSSAWTLRLNK